MIIASRTHAPVVLIAWLKISRIGTYVGVEVTVSRSWRLNIIERAKNQDVTKPIATVPRIATGTIRSGRGTSSAR